MYWKTIRKSTSQTETDTQIIKTTSTTKQLRITFSDIIGAGKTLKDKALNAYRNLTSLNATNPGNSLIINGMAFAGALNVALTGLEIYKTVSKVIGIATPIVKTVARGSGLMFSPGNVGDILQIVLGLVQKILITLLMAAINALKEWLWSLEIPLWSVTTTQSNCIQKNLQETYAQINKQVIDSALDTSFLSDIDVSGLKEIGAESSFGSEDLANAFSWEGTDIDWFSDAYETQLQITGEDYVRKLKGSLVDKGVYYSDDNGESWKQSEQKTGSWDKFAKIKVNGSYIYLAGGVDYIKEVQDTTDTEWINNKHYYYYDHVWTEYSPLMKKTSLVSEAKEKKTNSTLNKESLGIYFSTDNGESWTACTVPSDLDYHINKFCEFLEDSSGTKRQYSVSCASNSDGAWYTRDGQTWEHNFIRSTDKRTSENTKGRWTNLVCFEEGWVIVEQEEIKSVVNIDIKVLPRIIANAEEVIGEAKTEAFGFETKFNGQVFETTSESLRDILAEYNTSHSGATVALPPYNNTNYKAVLEGNTITVTWTRSISELENRDPATKNEDFTTILNYKENKQYLDASVQTATFTYEADESSSSENEAGDIWSSNPEGVPSESMLVYARTVWGTFYTPNGGEPELIGTSANAPASETEIIQVTTEETTTEETT